MRDAFSRLHPTVNFLYFALVLLFSMCLMHPLCLAISLACALSWSVYLGGRRALRFALLGVLPMLIPAALFSPLFSHAGVTILAYFPGGNPLTLESLAYGLAAATMLAAVVLWFSCYNRVMTSDKFIYLSGRIIPALSLMLSMVLRFVPRFKAQLRMVADAQKCVGRNAASGSLPQRARHGVRMLSILITWALENAVGTADSMKSRGYGLPGRTAFSIYHFGKTDRAALAWIGALGLFLLMMALTGGTYFSYFPSLRAAPWNARSTLSFLAYALLCATPLIIDSREDRIWKRLQSTI